MEGDSVFLEGTYRHGAFLVTNGRNQTTGSILAPRRRNSGWILLGTFGLASIFVLYLQGIFDGWVYPIIGRLLDLFMEKNQ